MKHAPSCGFKCVLVLLVMVAVVEVAIYGVGVNEGPRSQASSRPADQSQASTLLSSHARSAKAIAADEGELIEQIDSSLARASSYLIGQQKPDGAWRSEVYGAMRHGMTLTPFVMSTLYFVRDVDSEAGPAFDRGADYLVKLSRSDLAKPGSGDVAFPAYSSASASRVVALGTKDPDRLKAQKVWLDYLLDKRLNQRWGWTPSDLEFGGWGYWPGSPKKPALDTDRNGMMASNMSATVFGVAALRSSRVPLDDPIYEDILLFVKRCQNYSEDPDRGDTRFDDGGFFFMPNDHALNKAGSAGTDRYGHERFRSYGSATADGLRIMIRCGLSLDHPRVVAARKWLEKNHDPKRNPGQFKADREVVRAGLYFYYVWAASHAFMAANMNTLEREGRSVSWAEELAEELIGRQGKDGSWSNAYNAAKEDDPIVATSFAAATLAICRYTISSSSSPDAKHPSCQERSVPTR